MTLRFLSSWIWGSIFLVGRCQCFKGTCCLHLNHGIYSPTLCYVGISLSVCTEPYSTRTNLDTDRLRILSFLWGTWFNSNMNVCARFRILAAVSQRFGSERHSVTSQTTIIPRNMSLPSRLERFGTNLDSAGGSLPHAKRLRHKVICCVYCRGFELETSYKPAFG